MFPAGFGFFSKSWRGRIEHAGTYDAHWLKERHPYLPADFSFKYWCGAHPSLQIPHPVFPGPIPVALSGLLPADEMPSQRLFFTIPLETLFVFAQTASGLGVTKDMVPDTVVIDMHGRKVFCTYRIMLAEALQLTAIQLRYIAAGDRQKQKELAASISQARTAAAFLPLPPSLCKKG